MSKFKIERLPPRGVAEQVVEGQPLPEGVAPTWPAAGKEPEGWTPYDQERPHARRSHHDIWALHADGYPYWYQGNDHEGVRIGDWIVTDENGHTTPVPAALFRLRFKITGPA